MALACALLLSYVLWSIWYGLWGGDGGGLEEAVWESWERAKSGGWAEVRTGTGAGTGMEMGMGQGRATRMYFS